LLLVLLEHVVLSCPALTHPSFHAALFTWRTFTCVYIYATRKLGDLS